MLLLKRCVFVLLLSSVAVAIPQKLTDPALVQKILQETTTKPTSAASSLTNVQNSNNNGEAKVKSTTFRTEVAIKCLDDDCGPPKSTEKSVVPKKGVDDPIDSSKKKELDNPSSIIEQHKSDDDNADDKSGRVSGRKGVEPSSDIVTQISTVDHIQDLNNLKATTTTSKPIISTTKTITTTATASPSSKKADKNQSSKTSLLVGIVLACIIVSVLVFVGFKRLDAMRRRREYRRMNDFLIDGMYNEM